MTAAALLTNRWVHLGLALVLAAGLGWGWLSAAKRAGAAELAAKVNAEAADAALKERRKTDALLAKERARSKRLADEAGRRAADLREALASERPWADAPVPEAVRKTLEVE